MINVIINHDHRKLPRATKDLLPVQIYGRDGYKRGDISVIGNPIINKIKRMGVHFSPEVIDFLTISLAVTAADTFVKRDNAIDGWIREIKLHIPLCKPKPWLKIKTRLKRALNFLSGDQWEFEFSEDGFPPPTPYKHRNEFNKINGLDCVSLFSGGLDSAIGSIDLLEEGKSPLLVSHAYKGDNTRQNALAALLNGHFSRLSLNAFPQLANGSTDVSMRTRSINFLAFATIGCYALKEINKLKSVNLYVPENGFISLNAPLTPRRIGSLSTRTTHPYFLSNIQEIFNEVGIFLKIENPYRFQTKGEMILGCKNPKLLKSILNLTVSCSHWKRSNMQCGCCVPCIIRRSAIKKSDYKELKDMYKFQKLGNVLENDKARDDLFALAGAISRLNNRPNGPWILDGGPLPIEFHSEFKSIFTRGLKEVEDYLKDEGIL